LTKIVANRGVGFIVVPTAVESEAVERYGFLPVGRTKDLVTQFYAITAERRLTHPAILALTTARTSRASRKRRAAEASEGSLDDPA